jgi:hypothetical protein
MQIADIASSPVRAEVDSLDWVEKLIRIDTTTYSGNLALVGTVKDFLSARGLAVKTATRSLTSAGILFASVPDAAGDTRGGIIFTANCDVASVVGQAWNSNPFRPLEQNGRLYGRGACSMKGFVGLLLGLVPVMISATLSCPIHIALHYSPRTTGSQASGVDDAISEFAEDVHPVAWISGRPTNMQIVRGQMWKQAAPSVRQTAASNRKQPGMDAASRAATFRALTRLSARQDNPLEFGCRHSKANSQNDGSCKAAGPDIRPESTRTVPSGVISSAENIRCQDGAQAFDVLTKVLGESANGMRSIEMADFYDSSDEHVSLAWGPGQSHLVAAKDEYVELAQLARCSAGLKGLIAELSMDSMPPKRL